MPGRSYSANSEYRYGFNGKENDKDISEGGQDYGMRISDTRLGRFLSVDPLYKKYPFYTPYQFAGNSPILSIDIDGLEGDKNKNPVESGPDALNINTGQLFKYIKDYTDWFTIARETPKLNLTREDMIKITATVIGETGGGNLSTAQLIETGWVYYNIIASTKNNDVHEGLKASYAYRRAGGSKPSVLTMTALLALGDNTFANESAEGSYGLNTMAQVVQVKGDLELTRRMEAAKTLLPLLSLAFSTPHYNLLPGFNHHGYHIDINIDDGLWAPARQYLWLQRDGLVPNDVAHTFVIVQKFPASSNVFFAFNEDAINKYFKEHPDKLPKKYSDVPDYDVTTDTKKIENP